MNDAIELAARLINQADSLIIAAGAGIGVDSGLPDIRGNEGFWNAYPALGRRGKDFTDIACPAAFRADPAFAWALDGHKLNIYRGTLPQEGFGILHDWVGHRQRGAQVFTSNVDGALA
ncbi:MAG: hypothetical protein B7X46_14050 [Thiomonas sp. 15-66-11]|jgi:NAD-dependent SIR2 family protein deacetylase|nr:MAG: hypothetical protein B7X46_14050 [Thiomonas sp. 15-66-11]